MTISCRRNHPTLNLDKFIVRIAALLYRDYSHTPTPLIAIVYGQHVRSCGANKFKLFNLSLTDFSHYFDVKQ